MSGISRTGTSSYMICTSSTRPASPSEGQMIFETDTDRLLFYDSSTWQHYTAPGAVVQTVYTRSDTRTTYASNTTGNGTTITELNVTIAPRYSNSIIIVNWMINGEIHQDNVFLIHKDGALQTNPAGYNTSSGNVRYS